MCNEVKERRSVKIFNVVIYYELYNCEENFSIRVCRTGEDVGIKNFTSNNGFAIHVFNKIVDEVVYPCHLRDIIEDMVAEYDPMEHYGDAYEEKSRCTQRT